jgi:leucyl-tRNA synthetase
MAGCYLPADIFARYHRLKGNRVLMVSGSDMHGTPIMVTAQQEGAKPEEVALRYHKLITSSLEEMGISFDLFTHTHTPEHEAVVHEIIGRLDEAGFIEPRTTTAPYDPKAGQFLPDRYVEPDKLDELLQSVDAEQTVTTAQVVIKEAKGTALGQRHQPDGELGKFDRQRVQIDAVQAALGDETARDHRAGFTVAG